MGNWWEVLYHWALSLGYPYDYHKSSVPLERFSDVFGNGNQYTFEDTMNMIMKEPLMTLKQEYFNENFRVVNNSHIHFKCDSLFQHVIEQNEKKQESCESLLSKSLKDVYALNGNAKFIGGCSTDRSQVQNGSNQTWEWSVEYIKEAGDMFRTCGYYGNSACTETVEKYNDLIRGKVGMVLGTQKPWLESGLLRYGAEKVITVEYNAIISKHPKVGAIHPVELSKQYLASKVQPVDFIFTYSSLEHDGLGRYGDPMDPVADIETIARSYCLLKPDGILFLGIPIGPDAVVFPQNRIYGRNRLQLILPMWEVVDILGSWIDINDEKYVGRYENQPVFVLKKKGHYALPHGGRSVSPSSR
jgi:Caenorhabditis protein of unknown function, DUF268